MNLREDIALSNVQLTGNVFVQNIPLIDSSGLLSQLLFPYTSITVNVLKYLNQVRFKFIYPNLSDYTLVCRLEDILEETYYPTLDLPEEAIYAIDGYTVSFSPSGNTYDGTIDLINSSDIVSSLTTDFYIVFALYDTSGNLVSIDPSITATSENYIEGKSELLGYRIYSGKGYIRLVAKNDDQALDTPEPTPTPTPTPVSYTHLTLPTNREV